MNYTTSTVIALLIGAVVTINGFVVNVPELLNHTKSVVNRANTQQLATVLEIYYLDHEAYPDVKGGEELVNTLENGGYIRNRPLDPKVFQYETKDNNQDYSLTLK